MASKTIQKTPLNAFQIANGGKMADFAGWHMALWYAPQTLTTEHFHCRRSALLFDVSHMKQLKFRGKDALKFIEWATPADLQSLPIGKGRLTWLPNEKSGVIDDCIVHRRTESDEVGVVVNAGCAAKDEAHFRNLLAQSKMDVSLSVHHERALVAFQGPRAALAMTKFVDRSIIENLDFMEQIHIPCKSLLGTDDKMYLTRCGYTGEDGFEISIPNELAEAVADRLLKSLDNEEDKNQRVWLGGLGCRDTLRLEGGMCLYGHELSEEINPVEAGLMWQLTKRRKDGLLKGEDKFFSSDALLQLMKNPPTKRRVGLVSKGPCAREQAPIENAEKKSVGIVTSGSPSPSLGGNIHQAYLEAPYNKIGTEVNLMVRNKPVVGKVVKLPFVEGKFYRAPGKNQK